MASIKGRLARLKNKDTVEAALPRVCAPLSPAAFLAGWDNIAPHLWTRGIEYSLTAPVCSNASLWNPCIKGERTAADFSFFDFETTGLSGGAGTIPFLAAIGCFEGSNFFITQALIDDYPGEVAFLEFVLALLVSRPTVVTYNGRSFDLPLLRTRCIMNGIKMPELEHIDALFPARRLWKRKVASCALKILEREILDIDRGEDIPGAAIPRLWLDFAAGKGEGAMGLVCSHNASDISSLARLFFRMDTIFSHPLDSPFAHHIDAVRLGKFLYATGRREESFTFLESFAVDGDIESGLALARIYRREAVSDAAFHEARLRLALALPDDMRVFILRAKIYEHYCRDYSKALVCAHKARVYAEKSFFADCAGLVAQQAAIDRRIDRLQRKLIKNNNKNM